MATQADITFASPAWIALMHGLVHETMAVLPKPWLPDGATLRFGQTIRHVPPDGSTTQWGVVFHAQTFEVVQGPVVADVGIDADYEAVLPIARFVFQGAEPQALQALHAYWRTCKACGSVRDIGDMRQLPAVIARAIQIFHDRQATICRQPGEDSHAVSAFRR